MIRISLLCLSLFLHSILAQNCTMDPLIEEKTASEKIITEIIEDFREDILNHEQFITNTSALFNELMLNINTIIENKTIEMKLKETLITALDEGRTIDTVSCMQSTYIKSEYNPQKDWQYNTNDDYHSYMFPKSNIYQSGVISHDTRMCIKKMNDSHSQKVSLITADLNFLKEQIPAIYQDIQIAIKDCRNSECISKLVNLVRRRQTVVHEWLQSYKYEITNRFAKEKAECLSKERSIVNTAVENFDRSIKECLRPPYKNQYQTYG